MLAQGQHDGFLDGAGRWGRVGAASPVHEVGPPVHADVARFLVKELAIDAAALGDDGAFPLPHGPVPTVVIHHITAITVYDLLGRKTADAAIQQRQEPHLLDQVHHLGRIMYHSPSHVPFNYSVSFFSCTRCWLQ